MKNKNDAPFEISINECRRHKFACISVDHDGCGTRLTPSKCCGSWTLVKKWQVDEAMAHDAILFFKRALKSLKASPSAAHAGRE